jgi:hypothetical protein
LLSDVQVACSRQKENQFYGFAIGMTVLSGAMTVGSVSGGAFNPAVSTGLQFVQCCITGHCEAFGYIWMYWLSHFGAAALAAGCFLIIHPRTGIKQHTGAEDVSDRATVLPSACRSHTSFKAASAIADPNMSPRLESRSPRNDPAAAGADMLSSTQLLP